MATLEEIAKQFESALGTETGTTIAPGTVAPVGVTASGKKKLSWSEVVQKMADNASIYSNELLPDVPKGVTAQTFYRTGVKSGQLPQGLATFTSSPFGSFRGRMNVAQGGSTSAATPSTSSASSSPVVAPKSVIQTQQEQSYSQQDMIDASNQILDPTVNPNYGFADLAKFMMSPIASTFFNTKDDSSEVENKDGTPYFDFGIYTSDQIGYMIDNGMMNESQQASYAEGVDRMDQDGNAVDEKGNRYSFNVDENLSLYQDAEKQRVNSHFTAPFLKKLNSMVDDDFRTDFGGVRGSFKVGYQDTDDPKGRWDKGDYIQPSGKVLGGGTRETFRDLIKNNTALAKEIIDIRTIDPILIKELEKKEATDKLASRFTIKPAKKVLTKTKAVTPRLVPAPPDDSNLDDGDPEGMGEAFGAETSSAENPDEGFTAWASGGQIAMQEGGEAMQMPQPQSGQEAEMANLGMINEQAAEPQDGGQQSVKDDIPREADEGDYILPYETVLQVGLKQLNRYAKEAIDLAIKNDVNLKGTDLDPSDDVPIKVSNYEYHIPKGLVPYFGGGKKYLDKIRNEGLALRKRLEEEKQPPMQEQQPMEAAPALAPEPQMVPDAQPQAPQMSMMQEGGFVNDPVKALKSAEQALTSDSSQPTQSAYNQVQALERSRMQKQQPPMVDPTGRVVQQGFAAPQGYALGTPEGGVSAPDVPVDQQGVPVPTEEEVPTTQMETSATPDETQVAGSSPSASFDSAFKNATEQGKREFEYGGKRYSTVKREDKANFEKLKTLEIEKLMALTALGEARSENRAGMQAVMHVINNRVKSGDPQFGVNKFPNDPFRSVILHPNAFSALQGFALGNTKDEKHQKNFAKFMNVSIKDKAYKEAVEDARAIMDGELEDITNNALFYYNPEVVERPKYLENMDRKTVIGRHHFYNRGGFIERVGDTAA